MKVILPKEVDLNSAHDYKETLFSVTVYLTLPT